MGRKIILLSDGTGNSAAKVWRTNVWRTFEALDLSGSDQVAFYDDGVGTSSFKPLAILGGAFGIGLKRNVIDLYKFACRNYRSDDDDIYGFGFSRGGFTIRVVMGLILNQGLVTADTEQELDRKARAAYRAYRRERYHTFWHIEVPFRALRDLVLPRYDRAANRSIARIRFIGVWDTVAAYGLPLDEMTRGVSKWIWPLELPDHRLDLARVSRACQALALDEERTTFHPELWDERSVAPAPPRPEGQRYVADEQVSQLWFAGVHSNVGGGYPDDALAYIPFVWMIGEAQRCGLRFKSDRATPPADPDTFKNAISRRDKDGRLYDPRKGIGGYYRYGPRKLAELCTYRYARHDEVLIARPKIHESAFRRIASHARAYAPVGLPATYDVATDDGAILTPEQYGMERGAAATERAKAQEHVWNVIWARRIVYFLTVGATAWLLLYPLLRKLPAKDEYTSPIRWVSDLIRIVGGFLPGFAQTWIDGYARSPFQFLALLIVVCGLIYGGTRLAASISDRMGAIWRRSPTAPQGLPDNWIYRLRSSRLYTAFHEGLKRRWAPALFAVLFVYLGLTLSSHLLYNVQDVAGLTCRDDAMARGLARGEQATATFATSQLCNNTGIFVEGNGARYLIKVETTTPFRDGDIASPLGGFYTTDAPTLWQQALLVLGVPLRRELTRPWFRLVLRYGAVGGEEVFLDPDPEDGTIEATIRPTRSGELLIFVNDAVLGIPALYDTFYRNNSGTGLLTVKRR
ncbi:MAG: hypothetical protein BGP05_03770 [Rhizobiales bacterium 62-47]|nr:DUF2235 domain-containing protein [Hyphomicrobiales bacterium]OJY13038.1 MAG: hypothetical protein BGP05_03770 [Rhizobiales bacterium 62-47]